MSFDLLIGKRGRLSKETIADVNFKATVGSDTQGLDTLIAHLDGVRVCARCDNQIVFQCAITTKEPAIDSIIYVVISNLGKRVNTGTPLLRIVTL